MVNIETITLMNVDAIIKKIKSIEKRQGYFEYFINEYLISIKRNKEDYQSALRTAYHRLNGLVERDRMFH